MILYSIIIPMYNVEQYIERCLESVYRQGLLHNQFEVILVDDGSPDKSYEFAEAFLRDKSNSIIIRQKNKGLGGARNTGIANANGKYLLFLDSDDWLVESFLSNLDSNESDIIEFGVFSSDSHLRLSKLFDSQTLENEISGIKYHEQYKTINSACNKLYKLSFLVQHQLKFQNHIYGEDFEFNTKAYFLAKKVMSLNTYGIVFFQNMDSITRNINYDQKKKYIKDSIFVLSKINEFKSAHDIVNANNESIDNYFKCKYTYKNVSIHYLLLSNKFDYEYYQEVYRALIQSKSYELDCSLRNTKHNAFRVFVKYFRYLYILLVLVNSNRK